MSDQFERHEIEDIYIPSALAALTSLDAAIACRGTLLVGIEHEFTEDTSPRNSYAALERTDTYRARMLEGINPDLVAAEVPPEYLLGVFGALAMALVQHENARPASRALQALPPHREALDDEIRSRWLQHNRGDTLPVFIAGYLDRTVIQLEPHDGSYAISYVVQRSSVRLKTIDPSDITVVPQGRSLRSRLTEGYRRRTRHAAGRDLSK